MERRDLPQRRHSRTLSLVWRIPGDVEHKFFITIGFFDFWCTEPGEVFASVGKAPQSIQQLVCDACTVISIALQCGVPPSILAKSQARYDDGTPYTIIGMVCDALVNKSWE